jgi:hypothetical protein
VYLKGLEQNNAKPFEPLGLNYNKYAEVNEYLKRNLSSEQMLRLEDVKNLISQFESTFSLELLASVDFIMDKEHTSNFDEIKEKLLNWSNRKKSIFQDNHIKIAFEHLLNYAENPYSLA